MTDIDWIEIRSNNRLVSSIMNDGLIYTGIYLTTGNIVNRLLMIDYLSIRSHDDWLVGYLWDI